MARIYVGIRGGLLAFDEDQPEAVSTHFTGSDVTAVAVDPASPDSVFAGLYSGQEVYGRPDAATAHGLRGVWRSDDRGQTWQDVSDGLAHPAITALAIQKDSGGVLYAGSEPSTLAISRGGGAAWQPAEDFTTLPSATTWAFPPRPYTHHVRWITFDPMEKDRLYLCIEAGAIIQSYDGGQTWHDRTPDGPFDTHTLVAHSLAPGRLYAAAGDGFLQQGHGYAESRDSGQTWTRFGDGLRHHYLYGLAVDSGDPDVVLVSAAASAMQAHDPANAESYVYRRVGGGLWELAKKGLPAGQGTTIPMITAHPDERGVFYLASNQGVFRSNDAGASWGVVPVPWQPEYRAQNPHSLALAV